MESKLPIDLSKDIHNGQDLNQRPVSESKDTLKAPNTGTMDSKDLEASSTVNPETMPNVSQSPLAKPEHTEDIATLGCQGDIQMLHNPVQFTPKIDSSAVLPKVRKCNWENFINRFSEEEPIYAVDVLIAGDHLGKDMLDEAKKRTSSGYFSSADYEATDARVNKMHTNDKRVQRVRIQSPTLLDVLGKVTGDAWSNISYTFLEPFQYIIHHHENMKRELSRMESLRNMFDESPVSFSSAEHDPPLQLAIPQLQAYIEFVEADILPHYLRLRSDIPSGSTKVLFHDLWHLFKPGDTIYMPDRTLQQFIISNLTKKMKLPYRILKGSTIRQKIWRVWDVGVGYTDPTAPVDSEVEPDSFLVFAYYLDYDGSNYRPVSESFSIEYFEGDKDICRLDYYPLKYARGGPELLEEHRNIGKMFLKCQAEPHMRYSGWTFTTDPMGWPIDSSELAQPQYINSEVIIDFKEAYNTNPRLASRFEDIDTWGHTPSGNKVTTVTDLLIVWSDSKRSNVLSGSSETILTSANIGRLQKEEYRERDKFLNAENHIKVVPEGDYLALLPPRICAYSLTDGSFVPVDVRHMKSIHWGDGAFDKLQLEEMHKSVIQSAVRSHLRQRPIERSIENDMGISLCSQDFIRGKGRGLIIMLHGEPGTGKTATAEAVAQKFKLPLFPLSCGDLDNARIAELRLEEIFRLADTWGCILLIDEADVFLSARTSADSVTRNSLVSVFLRKLEYYDGIIFLTTNRIGKIDQAISSRLQLILHYKRFKQTEFENIFRINIDRLQKAEMQQSRINGGRPLVVFTEDIMEFVREHWRKHPTGKGAWNGRQIRNAFTIAASIARDEADIQSDNIQPQLRSSHFKKVEKLMDEFAQLRLRVLGNDDSQRALLNEERDDDYEGYNESEKKIHHQTSRQPDLPPQAAFPSVYAQYGANSILPGYHEGMGVRFAPSTYGQPSQHPGQWRMNTDPGYGHVNTPSMINQGRVINPASFMPAEAVPTVRSQTTSQPIFGNAGQATSHGDSMAVVDVEGIQVGTMGSNSDILGHTGLRLDNNMNA